jgi:hypothetical protein
MPVDGGNIDAGVRYLYEAFHSLRSTRIPAWRHRNSARGTSTLSHGGRRVADMAPSFIFGRLSSAMRYWTASLYVHHPPQRKKRVPDHAGRGHITPPALTRRKIRPNPKIRWPTPRSAISPADRTAVQLVKPISATTPAAASRTCAASASGTIRTATQRKPASSTPWRHLEASPAVRSPPTVP